MALCDGTVFPGRTDPDEPDAGVGCGVDKLRCHGRVGEHQLKVSPIQPTAAVDDRVGCHLTDDDGQVIDGGLDEITPVATNTRHPFDSLVAMKGPDDLLTKKAGGAKD